MPRRANAPHPRDAGIRAKKKGLETIQTLVIGGGGGNRTRVRKSSTVSPTCLARSFDLALRPPAGGLMLGELPYDLAPRRSSPAGTRSRANDSADLHPCGFGTGPRANRGRVRPVL